MNEQLQKNLFIHDNVESPLYYLSGTAVLVGAILGLLAIVIYTLFLYVKKHKGKSYTPAEIKEFAKIKPLQYLTIILSAFFTFVLSIPLFYKPIVEGWAEDTGVLIFFPFIAAVIIGGLNKVSAFKDNVFIHGLSFWKVYLFTIIYLGLRVYFF